MNNESAEKTIHDNFIRWGRSLIRASIVTEGIIISVDESKYTCVVALQSTNSDGSTTNTNVYNVPLKVLVGSQASLIEIPKVNSTCTLCFRDNNIQRPQLYQTDQCDKILVKIDNSTLQIDTNGFVFNGGSHGMVKADELKTQSEKDKAILDGFLQVLQTPVNEPGNGAPSAFQAALIAAIGTKQSGVWTALENDKIKQ
jgi:hypothetical protein